jgi:hypothetical protein
MPRPRHTPPTRLYRTIAVGFSILVVFLTATTLVLALSRAEILITPAREEKELNTTVSVSTSALAPGSSDMIPGTISEKVITLDASSPLTNGTLIEDRARGLVTVINNYNRSQRLVATTRFPSSQGVLFRSTEGITVPAGGTVNVTVRADQPGKKGEIAPGRFTIPGLWVGVQDKIYGESKKAMTGGERKVTAITPADLEKTRAVLAALQTTTLHQLSSTKEQSYAVFSLEKLSEKTLTPVGSESDAARMQGSFKLTTVMYDPDALAAFLEQQVALRFGSADRISLAAASLAIERVEKNRALLSVSQKVTATARAEDLAVDSRLLKGKKKSEAERILMAIPGIREARIVLTPGFLTRLPRLPDHIKITVTNP